MIYGSAVHGLRVCLPPSHTALVRTKPFLLRTPCVLKRDFAVGTGISSCRQFSLYRNADVISAAVRLDGVFGHTEIGGDSGVAVTFAAQVFNSFFLSSSHMLSSIRRGNKKHPSTVYRQKKGTCVPAYAGYSVLMKASVNPAAFTLLSMASAFDLTA